MPLELLKDEGSQVKLSLKQTSFRSNAYSPLKMTYIEHL